MNRRQFLLAASSLALCLRSAAQQRPTTKPATSHPSATQASPELLSDLITNAPPSPGSVILCRPTDHSVTASVMLHDSTPPASALIRYGPVTNPILHTTAPIPLTPGKPAHVLLDKLPPNTACSYSLLNTATRKPLLPDIATAGSTGHFHTARPPGSSFTFTIQADSHLDTGCRRDYYDNCLQNQLADRPDFTLDLGDTFMAGKLPSRPIALSQYKAQRTYLRQLCHSSPLLLTLGNHDGEELKQRAADSPTGLATWSNTQRKTFFPNPEPCDFYSANSTPHPAAGLLQNYYAFTWADALFVVLDPYWSSTASRGSGAGWNLSLGKTQYDWLASTLRASKARHKLIFIHQLTGGLDAGGRGGSEAAPLYEWGGHEPDNTFTFPTHRPGWQMPIHQLLVETKVRAVFHGHDHFYARQDLDGITYQLVPQPAHRNTRQDHAAEYGYRTGTFLPNSGHLRVQVSPTALTVAYIPSTRPNATPTTTYTLHA
jgi:hypothetical protein